MEVAYDIIHISHGFEGDIPEYQPRGDTKALARYVTRCANIAARGPTSFKGLHLIWVKIIEFLIHFFNKCTSMTSCASC